MLRRGLVTLVLAGLTLTFLALVTWRVVAMKTTLVHDAPPTAPSARPPVHAPKDTASLLRLAAPPIEHKPPPPLLDRPLAVVSLGWEMLAPALLANAGPSPSPASAFSPSGLAVSLSVADDMTKLMEALARGGADDAGADVAIVPLPRWLCAQDQLRPIQPVMFFVAGWSTGGEAVLAADGGDVDLSALALPVPVAVDNEDAAYLVLFALDASGVHPRDVALVPPTAQPQPVFLAVDAVNHGAKTGTEGRVTSRWSTAQASRLIPWVMVASRGWIEAHGGALHSWLRGWLRGVAEASDDVAGAARRIGRMPGAPQPLRLLQGLETWTPCSWRDNLLLFELDGPSTQSLHAVVGRTWRLLHEARLAGPVPRELPLSSRLLFEQGRAEAQTVAASKKSSAATSDGRATQDLPIVLTHPVLAVDAYELARDLTMLRGVFPSSVLRVTPRAANSAVHKAFEGARSLLPAGEPILLAEPNPRLSKAAVVEVLLAP